MSEPTTLGELLQDLTRRQDEPPASCTFEKGYNDGLRVAGFALRRIVYGTDEPCPTCQNTGWGSVTYGPNCGVPNVCPTCHGTGRIKTPGLVERLGVAAEHTQVPSWPERTYYLLDPTSREFSAWRSALRREIGEATP